MFMMHRVWSVDERALTDERKRMRATPLKQMVLQRTIKGSSGWFK